MTPTIPEQAVQAAEREAVLNYKAKLRAAFRKALSDLPEIAPSEISSILSSVYMKDEFWREGKRLQLEHGLDAVAPRVEQECGARAWSFIRQGILTAAAPHLAAVQVKKLEDWHLDQILTGVKSQINHNGWEEPYVRNRLRFELERILSALEPSSTRAAVLEEAAKLADRGNAAWLEKRDVTANKKEARDYETMAIACSHVAAAIRALSSHPQADKPSDDGAQGEWHRENGERSILLYTLRQDGWRKGQPVLVNDVTVRIELCSGSSTDISRIADTILATLPTPPAGEVA